MGFMTFMGLVALSLLIYSLFYAIVDRICKCCEYCAASKAFGKAIDRETMDNIIKTNNN